MADITVGKMADAIGFSPEALLLQLREAGIEKASVADTVSNAEKKQLLDALKSKTKSKAASPTPTPVSPTVATSNPTATPEKAEKRPEKVTLKSKQVSTLKVSSGAQKRTVSVEIRRKRVPKVAKPPVADPPIAVQETSAPIVEPLETQPAPKPEPEQIAPVEQAPPMSAQEQRKALEDEIRRAAELETSEVVDRVIRDKQLAEEELQLKKSAAAAAAAALSNAPPPSTTANQKVKPTERGRGPDREKATKSRHKRKELHVAKEKSGKRKKKMDLRSRYADTLESRHGFSRPTAPIVYDIEVPETISVADLAIKIAVKGVEVIKCMMSMGVMGTINQVLDQDTAILIVEEMGHRATAKSSDNQEQKWIDQIAALDKSAATAPRPPVVTIMGHVDHGKTSLLDYIRETHVTSKESGGITQHIGAYHVSTAKGAITFLDTPGHSAFSAMRARGAQCTDIVILVVAADDSVMPQTIEAIQHAKSAGVPIIVAVNKCDVADADPQRVTNDLSAHEIVPEAWGGEHIFIETSAHKGTGIDALLEAILLQADLMELQARDAGSAHGVVIETSLDKGRGPLVTVLVQGGVLKKGDVVVCGSEYGRVRALFNESSKAIDEVTASVPAVILGLSSTPNAGDEMLCVSDEKSARELASLRHDRLRDVRLASRVSSASDTFSNMTEKVKDTVNLLIKTDVQGSFEAISKALVNLSNADVAVRVIGGGVGGITASDVDLCIASGARLIGFNVRADNAARKAVSGRDIALSYHNVIYDVIDEVKQVASGLLKPTIKEIIIGLAEVRDVFPSSQFGSIAGALVTEGTARKNAPVRVLRQSIVIHQGSLDSLRRFKDDVNDVKAGTECGLAIKNYKDVRVGDQVEFFEQQEVANTL